MEPKVVARQKQMMPRGKKKGEEKKGRKEEILKDKGLRQNN